MPVYQYACTDCGHELEVRQSFSDDPLTACPACEGRLRKVLNAVGVVFKGSGFYRTDSRKEPAASSASGNASRDASTGSGASSGDAGGSSSGSGGGSSSGGGSASTTAAAAAAS